MAKNHQSIAALRAEQDEERAKLVAEYKASGEKVRKMPTAYALGVLSHRGLTHFEVYDRLRELPKDRGWYRAACSGPRRRWKRKREASHALPTKKALDDAK